MKSEVRDMSYEPVPDSLGNPGGGIKITWDEPATVSGGFLFHAARIAVLNSMVIYLYIMCGRGRMGRELIINSRRSR